MIEHYKSNDPTDSRGFILLIANTLRLGADLQPPSGWLRHYLLSHDPWKQFLPILRHDTELQLKRYNDITTDMIEDDEEGFDEDLDIDLGSAYAKSLGFEEEAPEEDLTPKRKKKKSKRSKKKKSGEEGGSDSSDSDNENDKETPTENHKNENEEGSPIPPPKHVVSAKEEKIMEEVKRDEVTDPSLSQESWWADLKGALDEEKEKKSGPSENIDWWASLKDELSNIEEKK